MSICVVLVDDQQDVLDAVTALLMGVALAWMVVAAYACAVRGSA